MKKSKSTKAVVLVLSSLMLIAGLAGCSQAGDDTSSTVTASLSSTGQLSAALGNENTAATESISATVPIEATPLVQVADVGKSDIKTEWDATATKVTLDSLNIRVEGSGATASGGVLTITKAGTYVISGKLTDGQIMVNATSEDKVYLILNGAEIVNKTGAPIYAPQCDKLIVTLADGTQNVLTDGGTNYQYADTSNEEPNAALFAKDDLTINGTGTLIVNAGFKNGIGTKDDLLIVSGQLMINAVNHGLRGNDSITVVDGDIQITAGNDGVQTNNTEDSEKGWVLIEGGTWAITAAHDGIQADNTLSITGGDFTITTGSGTSTDTASDSYKAFKSGTDITITGGRFTINSADDGIHANGNITINGGSYIIKSGDDGIHADSYLTINTGDIKVTQSYEGLEAANISITGGSIDLVATDDGLNAAGGNVGSGNGGRFGASPFAAAGAYSIDISGGHLTLIAGGDGIDSNGSLTVSGGTIISLISSSPDNGAIDCDGSVTFTGGTIIYGGTGTGSNPGGNSTQSYLYTDKGIKAGSEISLQQNGKTLFTFTPAINCQYLAASTPSIASGSSYEVYSDGALLTTVTAGTGGGGMMGGRGAGMNGQKPRR